MSGAQKTSLAMAVLLAASTSAAAPAHAGTEDSELIYECVLALDFAASRGVNLPVLSARAMAQFSEVTGNDPALRRNAEKAVDAIWTDYQKERGRDALDQYKLSVAQDCSDLYVELEERKSAAVEGQLNSLGTLSAASLRTYANRTGDYGEVANYLVYYYPYGKDLFKPNADGDLLGQLIVEAGASGLRKWSDEAIYSIATKHYWQYNPPATRLVDAEYRRRMRARRQSDSEARAWAQRAADDRARQARQANAPYVGSIGRGKAANPKPGSGVYTCTTYQGTGGGRVCKED